MDDESVGEECNQRQEGEDHPVERGGEMWGTKGLGGVNQPTRSIIGDTTKNISLQTKKIYVKLTSRYPIYCQSF